MKLYGYYLKRTKEIHPADWPPICKPKNLEDAEYIELIDFPGDHKDRVFLYIIWSDKFKYLQAWNYDSLKLIIPDKFKDIIKSKKKRKIWSEKLEKSLLKDARPN